MSRKKSAALILGGLIILIWVWASALGLSQNICGKNLKWQLDGGTLTISGKGDMYDFSAPPWEADKYTVHKVVVENGVTSIGDYAFSCCTSLTEVSLPKGLKAIGRGAFNSCGGLKQIDIPDSVKDIDIYAFNGCQNLTAVKIPENVTEIKSGVFSGCQSLSEVNIHNNVTAIGNGAFFRCESLTEVNLPAQLTEIGESAFFDCNLIKSITVPDKVTAVGKLAFASCNKLREINIGDNITSMGESVFTGTDYYYNRANWDGRLLTLKNYLINTDYGISGEIEIAPNITVIADRAFLMSDVEAVKIHRGIINIGKGAFEGCDKLKQITVSDENENYSDVDGILYSADKKTLIQYPLGKAPVYIPSGTAAISESSFGFSALLTRVVIPEGVTSIGAGAFEACEKLKSVTIPKSVTSIGDYAFSSLGGVTISCNKDTAAEQFAKNNNIKYYYIT